jgi:hypothetical protein
VLHLGEARHEVRRDVETIHYDRQTRLDQIAPRVPGMIAKQAPQLGEHALDLRLTTGHPQQDESHLGNGEEGNIPTGEGQTEGSLSYPELPRRHPSGKSSPAR